MHALTALAWAVLAAAASAAPAKTPQRPAATTLTKAIDAVLARPAFAPALWAIEVRSLDSGQLLYSRNAEKNIKPASTLKLVTTAAALDVFGAETRLETTLETGAPVDAEGRLAGDLYLVGRGDPNLSGRFNNGRITAPFEELADGLAAAGVRQIDGRLVGHDGLFVGERRGEDWTWGDLVWSYGAEVSALAFNDNAADITVTAGARVGDPASIARNPVSAFYSVTSTATTSAAGAKSDLSLSRDPGSSVVHIGGTLALGAPPEILNVALEDPARYATAVFAEVLAARGIVVSGGSAVSREPLPAGLRVLARHASPPMAEMVREVNKHSQNLHTEMLLRLLGVKTAGEGSTEAGRAAVLDFLKRSNVRADTWSLKDACGLSRSDLVTARGLVDLLVVMDHHPQKKPFRDSLPIAGVDGSLKNRLKGTVAEGRLVAKTGGISNVSGLAGYVTTRSGRRLAFALHVNHFVAPQAEAIAAMDAIALALAGQ